MTARARGAAPLKSLPPKSLTVLGLIPSDAWISDGDLADLAEPIPGLDVSTQGRVLGIRSLKTASAILVRKSDDGSWSYTRTPTGTGLLRTWERIKPLPPGESRHTVD